MPREGAPHKSPIVLAMIFIVLPLMLGGSFAAVALLFDLAPLVAPTGVLRSGIFGIVAGLAVGVAIVLHLRRGV
jgi:hypothetical protein